MIASHGANCCQSSAPDAEQCRNGTRSTLMTAHTSLNAHTVGVGIVALTGRGGSIKLLYNVHRGQCRDSPVSRCKVLVVLILDSYLSYVGLYLAY